MAIKDQCENCRRKNTSDCSENIVYDGNSCPSYTKIINLEKADNPNRNIEMNDSDEKTTEEFVYTSEYLKENSEIRGWLSFFLFTVFTGGLFSALYPIFTYDPSEYDGSSFLALADVLLGIMLLGLSCYTIYSFVKRKPNAVFLAKMYIVVVFASNLMSLIGGDFTDKGMGSLSQIVRSLLWSVIWFVFLLYSEVVEEVIPKEYRKLKNSDLYILVAFILIPLVCIAVGIKQVFAEQSVQENAMIEMTSLKANEYTDGRIIFKRPEGFSCNSQEVKGLKLYTLECESIGEITLCSDYENDRSQHNVNTYWANWENDELKSISSQLEIDDCEEINGHPYYYKVKKYEQDDNVLYWRFIMMFDYSTGKVCLISCYDGGYDEYIQELLRSIRFSL